jgi:hypothetical protein
LICSAVDLFRLLLNSCSAVQNGTIGKATGSFSLPHIF